MVFSATKGYLTKPKPGVMLNPLHPLSQGLVGYWLFNEGSGSKGYDISGHGNHGMLKNMAPNAQGSGWGGSKFGGGLKFDGVDDYVDCGDIDSLDGISQFTISVWVKPLAFANWKRVVSKDKNPNGNEGIVFGSSASTHGGIHDVALILHPTADWALGYTTGDSLLVAGEWHYWTMVFDGSGAGNAERMKFYFDGAQQTLTFAGSVGIPSTTPDTNYPVRIGEQNDTEHNGMNAEIDSVRIYNRALSAEEVKQLYHDPFCNLLRVPVRYVPAAPPVGAIMNQFQNFNIGADLYNGAIIA